MGAIAAAAVAWRAAAVYDRRRRLRCGEIRELGGLWKSVGRCRIFARAATEAAGRDRLPVVLVHGFGVSSSYFVPTAERLATEFAVYAPDLPGHGGSDTPAEAMDIPRLADALVAWMDAAGLHRASLVANSMGCQIVVDVAVRHPERVDRLVLIGPTADPSGRTAVEHLRRLVRCVPFERPSLAWPLLVDYARMGPRLLPEMRSMLLDRIDEKLPEVAVPTFLVRGEHDFIAPRRWLIEAARLQGTRRVFEIPWWGHAVHFSGARQLVDVIAPFLRASHHSSA